MTGTLVLMYHAVRRPGDVIPATDYPYSVTEAAFREHLAALVRLGCRMCDAAGGAQPRGCTPVVLTFDDSWASHAGVTLECLEAAGMKAVFFLTPGQFGLPGMMTAADVRRLADAGMTIGSHGMTHRYFDDMDTPELGHELAESRRILRDVSGQAVEWLSLPGGRDHRQLSELAAMAGYTRIFTSRPGLYVADGGGLEPEMVPRMPVMAGCDAAAFQRLVMSPAWCAGMRLVRHCGLGAVRTLLGNARYERLRAWMVRGRVEGTP